MEYKTQLQNWLLAVYIFNRFILVVATGVAGICVESKVLCGRARPLAQRVVISGVVVVIVVVGSLAGEMFALGKFLLSRFGWGEKQATYVPFFGSVCC